MKSKTVRRYVYPRCAHVSLSFCIHVLVSKGKVFNPFFKYRLTHKGRENEALVKHTKLTVRI